MSAEYVLAKYGYDLAELTTFCETAPLCAIKRRLGEIIDTIKRSSNHQYIRTICECCSGMSREARELTDVSCAMIMTVFPESLSYDNIIVMVEHNMRHKPNARVFKEIQCKLYPLTTHDNEIDAIEGALVTFLQGRRREDMAIYGQAIRGLALQFVAHYERMPGTDFWSTWDDFVKMNPMLSDVVENNRLAIIDSIERFAPIV